MNSKKITNIPSVEENPLFHDTWKLLKNYRDAVWNLELAVQQAKHTFEIEYGNSIERSNKIQRILSKVLNLTLPIYRGERIIGKVPKQFKHLAQFYGDIHQRIVLKCSTNSSLITYK